MARLPVLVLFVVPGLRDALVADVRGVLDCRRSVALFEGEPATGERVSRRRSSAHVCGVCTTFLQLGRCRAETPITTDLLDVPVIVELF